MAATLTTPLLEIEVQISEIPLFPAPTVGVRRPELVDPDLVSRVAEGDEDAFADLYRQTSRIVYGMALRLLKEASEAEDAMVNVYLQVWRKASAFDPLLGSATAWLLVIARSRILDRLRAAQNRRRHETLMEGNWDAPSPHLNPEDASVVSHTAHRLRVVLAELPSAQSEAIRLAYYQGMTHCEIAAATGRPLGTIKTQIRQGMARLRMLFA
jgi:RNA polymerase sigma-70 factor (ECF subfamily)